MITRIEDRDLLSSILGLISSILNVAGLYRVVGVLAAGAAGGEDQSDGRAPARAGENCLGFREGDLLNRDYDNLVLLLSITRQHDAGRGQRCRRHERRALPPSPPPERRSLRGKVIAS